MIVFLGNRQDAASWDFVSNPEFLVWLFLIWILTALFTIIPFYIIPSVNQLRKYCPYKLMTHTLSSLTFLLLFFVPYLLTPFFEVKLPFEFKLIYFRQKILVIMLLGFFGSVLPTAIGIWLIQSGIHHTIDTAESIDHKVRRYLDFRALLQRFITIMGVIVGLATLGTGASRSAHIAAGIPESDFPALLVLLYGAYYTTLTAVLYIPANSQLLNVGRNIRDMLCQKSTEKLDSWKDELANRAAVDELLQLKTTLKSFQSAVAISAPLISGIVSALLD